ncbi:MAG: hypothetical protein IKG81_10730 [Bacteroidales bacterium]|nr:hypothetical protein [Bacteroidales bacterium]
MKKATLLFLVTLIGGCVFGQVRQFPPEMKAAYNTYMDIQRAFKSGSKSHLAAANLKLKAHTPNHYGTIRIKSGDTVSLNHHYIYDPHFIDSLIQNRLVYSKAQEYTLRDSERGLNSSTKVLARNFALDAKGKVRFSTVANGKTCFAVIGEPYALLTLRVTDKQTNKVYGGREQADTGKPHREAVVPVPQGESHSLIIEVINCTNHPVSFVIIKG